MAFGLFNHQVLHFRDDNARQPRSIVFANSLGTDLRIWDEVVAYFAGDFRTLRYDLRGHGLSEAPPAPYAIDDHVADLVALLDAREIRSAILVGISVGGMIAQSLAARRPDLVQLLILCDTAHKIGTLEMWSARIEAIRKGGMSAIADGLMERWFSAEFRQTRSADLAGYRNMLVRVPAEGYIGTCAALRDADLTEASRRLTQPTLCLAGEEDRVTSPELVESLSKLIPNASFGTIPRAGHLPCIEQPRILAGRIEPFIRRDPRA
ncbi:MAG TPA: 3-oxoadipate enol-lactonase [Dongiaceae bacterium]|jgi:3-oxoadipate enol-lactonase